MIDISSGAANRRVALAAAVLMFAGFTGYLALASSASAQAAPQAQSPAECAAKCDAEEQKCLDAQSSEELCDYDKKQCKKACGGE